MNDPKTSYVADANFVEIREPPDLVLVVKLLQMGNINSFFVDLGEITTLVIPEDQSWLLKMRLQMFFFN